MSRAWRVLETYLEDEKTFDVICAAIMEFCEDQTGDFDGKSAELATCILDNLLAEVLGKQIDQAALDAERAERDAALHARGKAERP